jgi:hypothetical protein
MAENLDVFKFGIIDEEMPRIAELDTGAGIAFDSRDVKIVSRIGTLQTDDLTSTGRRRGSSCQSAEAIERAVVSGPRASASHRGVQPAARSHRYGTSRRTNPTGPSLEDKFGKCSYATREGGGCPSRVT